jgi:hypothetical protein
MSEKGGKSKKSVKGEKVFPISNFRLSWSVSKE